jgi:plastocyanin
VKCHHTTPASVRTAVLAAILSSLLGTGALAQNAEPEAPGPSPVAFASPAPSEAASGIPLPSPFPEGSPTPSGIADAPEVTMRGSVFHPVTIEVTAGETVEWFNDDVTVHTVTALDGSFNSGVMVVGVSFSVTFATPGTVDYICAIHPEMQGTVTVTE